MAQLFKTAACFTDIHYGLKQNSRLHLEDCRRYVDWFIAEAKAKVNFPSFKHYAYVNGGNRSC